MPSNWLHIDTSLPSFTGEEGVKEQVTTIQNYMYMLVEQLRYTLHNLDLSNMNGPAVEQFETRLTAPIYASLEGQEGELSRLALTVDGLSLEVSNGSGSSTISLRSGGIVMSSASITFYGMVTFADLSTAGATTINGGNITTGVIRAITMEGNEIRGGTVTGATINSVSGSDNGFRLYYQTAEDAALVGGIRFDSNGAGTPTDAALRMYVYTLGDWAMKIESQSRMSIEAAQLMYVWAASLVLRGVNEINLNGPVYVNGVALDEYIRGVVGA